VSNLERSISIFVPTFLECKTSTIISTVILFSGKSVHSKHENFSCASGEYGEVKVRQWN